MNTFPDGTAQIRWKDGTFTVSFHSHFKPRCRRWIRSPTPTATQITLTRNPARLFQITQVNDPVGRSLDSDLRCFRPDRRNRRSGGALRAIQLQCAGDAGHGDRPEGGVTRYDYDAQNRPIRETDARGVVIAQNTYDANGRVIQQVQADGGTFQFDYTLLNPTAPASPVIQTVVTDPLGPQTTYRFNPVGFLTDVTDSSGQVRLLDRAPGANFLTALRGNAFLRRLRGLGRR